MRRIILNDSSRVGAWVAQQIGRKVEWAAYGAIGVELDGELIGGVVMNEFEPGRRCFIHVAATSKKWLSRDLIIAVFSCIFIRNRCNVALATVDADNRPSLKLCAGIGFNEACRVPFGAGECDMVLLAMQRSECKWLGTERVGHGK